MDHFQFFFDTFYESAKLGALRAVVHYVSSTLRALVPYVPRVIHAIVPYVLSCPTCSHAISVPYLTWSRALRTSCPTCSGALRTLVTHVFRALSGLVSRAL